MRKRGYRTRNRTTAMAKQDRLAAEKAEARRKRKLRQDGGDDGYGDEDDADGDNDEEEGEDEDEGFGALAAGAVSIKDILRDSQVRVLVFCASSLCLWWSLLTARSGRRAL